VLRAVAIIVALAIAPAVAIADEVPCDRPHAHYAFVHSARGDGERPDAVRRRLETLAATLRRDGYSAVVRGTSSATCSDGEHSMPCADDSFWLQLNIGDAQIARLVDIRDPHVPSEQGASSREISLARAPYKALRPFATMSLEVACVTRP
jgi:hypothetical protein